MNKKSLVLISMILLLLITCDLNTGKATGSSAEQSVKLNIEDVRNVPPAPEGYKQYNGEWTVADTSKISLYQENSITGNSRLSWDYNDYKHLHATTNYTNHKGISSIISVVNPDVPHNTSTDLGFFYAYIMVFNASRDKWIQVGWSEASWKDDARYVTLYDTETYTWYFYEEFPLTDNSCYFFSIISQGEGKWSAWLWWQNKWVLLRTSKIDLVTPELTTQVAEVCSVSHNWFNVPEVHFNFGSLLVNYRWNLWTSSYPVTEYAFEVSPYHMEWQNDYYRGKFYYMQ